MNINGREISQVTPCYVIAEMSANHGGSFKKALAIVRAAKESGADAIKLQTYTPDTMTIDCHNEYFSLNHRLWNNKTLYQLYKEAQTPWEWHKPLKEEAEKLGLQFFSTPFDETAVDFLETLDIPAYKIASFELTDDPLLGRVGRTHKPVILSTGMATAEEIGHALDVLKAAGTKDVALLKCVSVYPAPIAEMNLLAIPRMKEVFRVPVGFSDHSIGEVAAATAVALGAEIVEKHIRLAGDNKTPDSGFSATPDQFKLMVERVRSVQESLGEAKIGRTLHEQDSLRFRRSIFVVKDIKEGEIITSKHVRIIRPGYGLAPSMLDQVLGKPAKVKIVSGTPLQKDMIYLDG